MTTLATADNPGGAITKAQAGEFEMVGGGKDDLIYPRLHVVQALKSEAEKYGKLEEGTLVNSVTGEVIASPKDIPALRFVLITGWIEWIKFKELRGSGIEYRYLQTNPHAPPKEIPAADLEWTVKANGRKSRAATKFMNFMVLLENDPSPLILSYKGTSANHGRTLNTMQQLRGNRGRGLFGLSLKDEKNDMGSWVSVKPTSQGDPSPELADLAKQIAMSLAGKTVVMDVSADEPGPGDSGGCTDLPEDGIPI